MECPLHCYEQPPPQIQPLQNAAVAPHLSHAGLLVAIRSNNGQTLVPPLPPRLASLADCFRLGGWDKHSS